jgi:hypothetical protein
MGFGAQILSKLDRNFQRDGIYFVSGFIQTSKATSTLQIKNSYSVVQKLFQPGPFPPAPLHAPNDDYRNMSV